MTDEAKESIKRKLNELHLVYLTVDNSLVSKQDRINFYNAYKGFIEYVKLYLQDK